ncbi:PTS sugar transporter subunit IIA [Cetobacterium sp. 8H]|uniref:PTS sugar transporter subunit IIA n=1 Tax=Cetobacterium sp. 8H TaxID=2759681 RepID=UPI00163CAB25|nr:PTS sugar transporter subunit IIA [Cetobacterium sp. 8H]MBC2850561.1 PTS sugar transporter subunit IIA [Cetobacterium sp. 8H]
MLNIVKITDYMSEELVSLDLKAKNKDEALKELSDLIGKSDRIEVKESIYKALLEREVLGSTGIGKGVAIPHAKTDAAQGLTIAFGVSRDGVDFKSLDKEKVKIFFVFASPFKDSQVYLKVLARISRLIRDEKFREKLLSCGNSKEILDCINKEEAL